MLHCVWQRLHELPATEGWASVFHISWHLMTFICFGHQDTTMRNKNLPSSLTSIITRNGDCFKQLKRGKVPNVLVFLLIEKVHSHNLRTYIYLCACVYLFWRPMSFFTSSLFFVSWFLCCSFFAHRIEIHWQKEYCENKLL